MDLCKIPIPHCLLIAAYICQCNCNEVNSEVSSKIFASSISCPGCMDSSCTERKGNDLTLSNDLPLTKSTTPTESSTTQSSTSESNDQSTKLTYRCNCCAHRRCEKCETGGGNGRLKQREPKRESRSKGWRSWLSSKPQA